MEAVLEIIDSMNLPIYKPTKQSMKRYIKGVIREAKNFSVLRASEFLNFSYQRSQYLVSEARFRDKELEQTRLRWAVSQSSRRQKEPEFDYGTNDLDMDNLRAIGCYMERARMDNKLFRTAKSYLALSRARFHKLSSYIRHFHIVMLIFTILLFISTKSRLSIYQSIKTMVKYKN